jgi:hypothetical protein
LLRLALSFVSKISGLLSMTRRLVSSAKRIDKAVSVVAWRRSFIYSKNNREPNTEPCGTPCWILDHLDVMLRGDELSFKLMRWYLSLRYGEYKFLATPVIPYISSLCNRILWFTQSKTFSTSQKSPLALSLLLNAVRLHLAKYI